MGLSKSGCGGGAHYLNEANWYEKTAATVDSIIPGARSLEL